MGFPSASSLTRWRRCLGGLALVAASLSCGDSTSPGPRYAARTRTYYVQAEYVNWNYAPLGTDPVHGQPLPSPWGDSLVYPKVRYIEYSDAGFTTPVPQPAYLGLLGPIIRGVVGDTLKVVFHNATAEPFSMHPHGVRYAPGDEGALYNPPRGGGDTVSAGATYTYTWFAEPESGPRPGEPSSKVWLYHSHGLDPEAEQYRGLFGTIVITDPAHARDDATPDDVDREFVTLWLVINENTPTSDPADEEKNLRHSINGLMFGNLTGLTMQVGEKVRWYLVALGTEVDLHTPHWHGEKVLLEGRTYTDVVELLPASMKVGDMAVDNPGTWLVHCHVNDHVVAGMYATYTVGAPSATPPDMANLTSGEGWMPFGPPGPEHTAHHGR